MVKQDKGLILWSHDITVVLPHINITKKITHKSKKARVRKAHHGYDWKKGILSYAKKGNVSL